MKKSFYLSFMLLSIFMFSDCGSSKKSLQRGDYHVATMDAIRQLRTSPDSRKQQEVLVQAYSLLTTNSRRKINNAMDANAANKYSITADEYLMLNQVADAIYTCPKALQLIPNPEQFNRELSDLLPKAAEEAYREGESRLRLNTIPAAREAFQHFSRANKYIDGFRNVYGKMAEALEIAIMKVVVRKPITPQNYQLTSDFFYDNLIAKFSETFTNTFVRFYTEEEAVNDGLTQPDHYLDLDFRDFAVGNLHETKNTVELKRDSVKVGTTSVNGRNRDVYGTVKAEYATFRREVISQGTLSAKIINAVNNRIEQNRNFSGKFTWFNEWASYIGDDRALTDAQKKLTRTEPVMPPPQQTLFIEFTKPIFDQTVSFVRSYYSKYR